MEAFTPVMMVDMVSTVVIPVGGDGQLINLKVKLESLVLFYDKTKIISNSNLS